MPEERFVTELYAFEVLIDTSGMGARRHRKSKARFQKFERPGGAQSNLAQGGLFVAPSYAIQKHPEGQIHVPAPVEADFHKFE
jgi:hypothetical protein